MSGLDDADDRPGVRYEAGLPADERRADGQFYTPPAIARALVRWALPPAGGATDGEASLPRVLDPAAGAGAFALAAYDRLATGFDADPRAAVDRIALVDKNEPPLALAADALAERAGVAPTTVRARARSFFDCEPGDLVGSDGPGEAADHQETGGPAGDRPEDGDRPTFDAVVGNPPFVRHEDLPDKEHYRAHLGALGPGGGTPYRDGDRAISGRSDASVYFLTHATRFLRPGGRLAFVAPRKWLTARYAESLRAFVADHYRVAAVAAFPERAFDGALVDTLLVLLERRADPEGPARLVGLPGRPDGDDLVAATGDDLVAATGDDLIAATGDALHDATAGNGGDAVAADGGGSGVGEARDDPTVVERAGRRVVDLPRRRFREAATLAHYLDAPAPVLRLLDGERLVPLGDLADATYGYKTGANDFFFLDPRDRERWPVDDRFLAPAVTSLRQVEGRDLGADDVETAVLDVHGYVASVLDGGGGDAGPTATTGTTRDDPATAVTAALARDGYDVLREYVEHGERRGHHERATCAARRVWFDLGPLAPPAVLHPKFFDERVVVARNRGGLVPSNAIDCLRLHDDVDPAALLGALNATLHRTLLECFGRAEGGGALQLMTYELSAVPVLDVRALSAAETGRIARAFEALVAAGGDGRATRRDAGVPTSEDAESAALDRLDRAVLDALGAAVSVERLRDCRREMVARRTGATDG